MMEENNYANGPLVVESVGRQPLVRSGGGGVGVGRGSSIGSW